MRLEFHAMDIPIQYPGAPEENGLKFEELQKKFQPVPVGRDVETNFHCAWGCSAGPGQSSQ